MTLLAIIKAETRRIKWPWEQDEGRRISEKRGKELLVNSQEAVILLARD